MKLFRQKYGEWAIVVGSAEGLGEAYSIELAKRKMNLLMIDNQEEKMITLAEKLEKDFSIITKSILIDLASKDAVEKIMDTIAAYCCMLQLSAE